jgi:DNA-binding transcriptional MocR family regulator
VSRAGWVPAYRAVFEPGHYLACNKRHPASRVHAWLDLVQLATHKPRQTRDPNVNLGRGELVVSLRSLAKRWAWHRSSVERLLNTLKKRGMIRERNRDTNRDSDGTPTETPLGTVYVIVNYDTYNTQEKASETPTETPTETAARQEQEVKKLRSTSKPTARRAKSWRIVPDDWMPTDRHRSLATELGVSLNGEEAKFRDHEFKEPKTDPNRAFSRWIRTASEYNGRSNGKRTSTRKVAANGRTILRD